MKRTTNCLYSSMKNFISSLIPFLFVVGLIFSLNLAVGVSRGLIYVNKSGAPLENTAYTGEKSVRATRMIELSSDLHWHSNPARLAEYDRLSSATGPDAVEVHIENGPPSSEP